MSSRQYAEGTQCKTISLKCTDVHTYSSTHTDTRIRNEDVEAYPAIPWFWMEHRTICVFYSAVPFLAYNNTLIKTKGEVVSRSPTLVLPSATAISAGDTGDGGMRS